MENEAPENISSLTPPHTTDKPDVRDKLLCQDLQLMVEQEEGAGQDGWDLEGTYGESKSLQGQAHLGLMDRSRHPEVGASGINRLLNPPAATYPDFSNSCKSSFNPCFVPRFWSSEGPLCYLNLMVSMAFAQCFWMAPCKESGC